MLLLRCCSRLQEACGSVNDSCIHNCQGFFNSSEALLLLLLLLLAGR
jgi:hypothetical protein